MTIAKRFSTSFTASQEFACVGQPATRHADIDALRGWAILGVVLVHAENYAGPVGNLLAHTICQSGARGVQLFFVLSACTVFGSLMHSRESRCLSLTSFLIRRISRILPLFLAGIVFYRLFWGQPGQYQPADYLVASALLHGLWPPALAIVPGGWSICCEFLFYILIAALFWCVRGLGAALMLFVSSIVVRAVVDRCITPLYLTGFPEYRSVIVNDFRFFFVTNQLPVFALGIIMYFIRSLPKAGDEIQIGKSLLCLSLLMMFAFLNVGTTADILPRHILFGAAFVVLGCSTSFWMCPALVNRPMCVVGTLSYSLYMWHFAVLHLLAPVVQPISDNSLLRLVILFVGTIGLTLPFAWLTYVTIEQTGIRAGRTLAIFNEQYSVVELRRAFLIRLGAPRDVRAKNIGDE
jgi:peptidoglycan/LPS O-acetylase OafA/YrhL